MTTMYQALADRLDQAYRSGPVPPLRDGLAADDAVGAYAVQAINTQRWAAAGRRIVGRKIGLTAKAVQQQLGVDQPDFGVLFDDMAILDGASLSAGRLIQPKAEAEVALVMARDVLDADVTIEQLAAAVDHILPAIEVVDSRIADWRIGFADTVADNGSSAFFVLGREPRRLCDVDLLTCAMTLNVNGAIVSHGTGAACLGHPMNAALWLAKTLAGLGAGLRAGDVVLTGALGPMVAIEAGDRIRVSIDGLGACGFTLSGDDA